MKTQKIKDVAETPKKRRRALDITVNVILVLVVLFGILCSYTAFVSKRGDGIPEVLGLRFFAIQSNSMEPEFYEGDLIVDRPVKDYSDLEVGDVISFWTVINGERVVNTHRITEITDNESHLYFTTQGDNNTIEDAMGVHQGEIVGVYKFAIPKLGAFIDFLQTGTGFLLVIVLPVFLFFIYNLVQFFRTFFDYRMEKMRLQLQQEMKKEEEDKAKENKEEEKERLPDPEPEGEKEPEPDPIEEPVADVEAEAEAEIEAEAEDET